MVSDSNVEIDKQAARLKKCISGPCQDLAAARIDKAGAIAREIIRRERKAFSVPRKTSGVEAVTPRSPEPASGKTRSTMALPSQLPQSGVQASSPQSRDREFHKTKMCKFASEGSCTRGESCTFAHTSEERKTMPDYYRTRLCDSFKRNACRQEDCSYAHGNDQLQMTQVTSTRRNLGDDVLSDAHDNKHFPRVHVANKSPCASLASSSNLCLQATEYLGSSDRERIEFENDDDIDFCDFSELREMNRTNRKKKMELLSRSRSRVEARVVKTFWQFGNMADGPSVRRVSSWSAGRC